MPRSNSQPDLTPADRLREVATILARGVVRWRKQAKIGVFAHSPGPGNSPGIGLEVPAKTGLSVSLDTRGLRPRDDGDDA
jgi:hypothetical protein